MPEALDLRAARADVLWALGQRENALALYRDVLARHAALPPSKAGIIPPDRLEAMSSRLVEAVLLGEEPKPSEVEALVEACSRPDASPEWVIGAATLFMCYDIQHPMRGALLERAASLAAPEDDRFELAVAETKAQKGNPRPAIRLALKRLDRGDLDDQTVMLIRSAGAVARPGQLAAEEQARLAEHLRSMKSRNECGEALVDLLARCADPSERLAALWEAIQPIYGEHPGILKALAACYEVQGRDARAADLLRRAAECAEMDDASTIRMARINARLQRTQPEHLPLAERAHALEPADQDIALYLASLYLEAGRLPEAQEILLELVEKADERVAERILWMLGSNLRVATTQPLLLLLLVRVCLRLGRLDEALMNLGRLQPSYSRHFAPIMECYSELIAKDPSNLQARMERAILWRLSGNAAEAIEDLTHARKLAPDNTDILGELAEATRQKLEAERSTDANEWAKLGDLLFEAGDADGALDACVRAVELDANSERCLVLLARVQLETGALALCHQTLRRLPASPRRVQLLQRLAAAFEDTGDFAGAAAVLSEALDDSGTQRETIRRLRDLHLKRAEVSQRSTSNREILSTLSTKAQGRYDIREEIGRGSMGVVYKAYDKELDEVVVLKILPADFARNPEMVARFRNEAKAARKLAHPNIVRIHDIGEEDGRKHLSMEYVSGGDLKQRLRERGGPFPIAEAVRIAREIARGLAHAHSEGVLHRDIKPANILMTPSGRVKISDFGIAALVQEAEGRLRYDTADTVAGTPLYMSPEQFAGHDLSPATDYYSLGVILYELLAGHPPFTRGSISYHHQFTPPAPIPGIPMSSWKVLERLLRKEPRERYLSAVDLLQDLDRIDPFGRGRSQEAVPMLTLDDLTDPTDLGLGHMPTPRPAASPGVDLNGERTPLNIRAATDVEGVGLEIVDPGHDSTKVIKTRPMQS
jgi:serine/threonine protein kinase/Tfp pilus assembly protein PilF